MSVDANLRRPPSRRMSLVLTTGGVILLAAAVLAVLIAAPYRDRPDREVHAAYPDATTVAVRGGRPAVVAMAPLGPARLWELDTGRPLAVEDPLPGPPAGAYAVGLDRRGRIGTYYGDAGHRAFALRYSLAPPRWAEGTTAAGTAYLGFRGADLTAEDARTGERRRRRIGVLPSYTADADAHLRWAAWATPDGVCVAPFGNGPKRRLWDGPFEGDVPSVEFSADGHLLAVHGLRGGRRRVRFWRVGTWKELAALGTGIDVNATVHFSPDGRSVAVSVPAVHRYLAGLFGLTREGLQGWTNELVNVPQVWDLAARRPRFDWRGAGAIHGHAGRITEMAWSPDGRHLATLDEEGRIATWDAVRGRFERFLSPQP